MKITKLETFTKSFVSFVKVTIEDGSIGFGQMSTYHADITNQIFHKQVAPWILGKTYYDFDDLADFVFEREHKFPGSYLLRALAGLDTALWDLKGKIESKPVVSLIGGSPGNLNLWFINEKRYYTDDEANRFNKLFNEKGVNAFKFRVGSECGRGVDEWEGRTLI